MSKPVAELHVVAGKSDPYYWRDMWLAKEILLFLIWRDIKVKYKQTVLGVVWILLRPLLMLTVLVLVFDGIARLGQFQDAPYPLVVLTGLLPWLFFSNSFLTTSSSLTGNSRLITRVYFPRLLIPAASALSGLVDFVLTLLLLLVPAMFYYGRLPGPEIVFLPLFMLLTLCIIWSAGTAFSAFNVYYRDVRFIVPFIVQFGLFLSPVGFRANHVPASWQWVYELNPLVGAIEGFRWSLLSEGTPAPTSAITTSIIVTTILTIISITYFRKVERRFADVI